MGNIEPRMIWSKRETGFIYHLLLNTPELNYLLAGYPIKSSEQPDAAVSLAHDWSKSISSRDREAIRQKMGEMMLPEESFRWIHDSNRALFFLYSALLSEFANTCSIQDVPEKERMLRTVYSYFDQHLSLDLDVKSDLIDSYKIRFESLASIDMRWIDDMKHDHLEWALSYLKKNQASQLFQEIIATTEEQLRTAVIASIDLCSKVGDGKELMLRKMKSAWAVKRYRSDGKKNLNCRIEPKTFKNLTSLAEQNRCSKTEMIERLVEDAMRSREGKNAI